jgi:uncharacterized membrane protein (UPF0127 family)
MPHVDNNGIIFNINNEQNNVTRKTNEETDIEIAYVDMNVSIYESFHFQSTFEIISLG